MNRRTPLSRRNEVGAQRSSLPLTLALIVMLLASFAAVPFTSTPAAADGTTFNVDATLAKFQDTGILLGPADTATITATGTANWFGCTNGTSCPSGSAV